jgi:hypothetical protein
MCSKCGDKFFPKQYRKLYGITVIMGTCPECRTDNVTLIPIVDFEYASGDDSKWD